MESFIKLMPEGVGFIPAHAGVRAGNEQELQEALTVAEKKVARLAELGADVVMIMGAPPTMVRGHGADRQIADSLTAKYKIPVTVATIAQVDAFRALGMKQLVGITYFTGEMNQRFAKFLEDDGFVVKAMEGIEVPFKDAGKLSPEAIYNFRRRTDEALVRVIVPIRGTEEEAETLARRVAERLASEVNRLVPA
jgi:maleate cis-trans isomerase